MPSSLSTKLYAKWGVSDEAVTVKFETFNGTKVETAVGRAGDALTLPVLTRANCNFAGWFDKEFKTRYTAGTFPEKGITLYAKWELIPQLCSFENVEDFPKPDNGAFTQRCLLGDDKYKTKKDAYKSKTALHYSFQRGFDLTGSAGKGTPAGVMLVDETGQKVKLTSGKTYVITFKYKVVDYISSRGSICLIAAGGGAWSDRQVQDYRTASIAYDETDEKKGWQTATFTHTWNAQNDSGSYCYIAIGGEAEVYVDDVLVYEKDNNFKVKSDKMMLCFDSGVAPMIDTVFADRGAEIKLPELEMEGYRFLGWAYDEGRLEIIESETIKLDKMYTKIYADWYKIPPVVDEPEPEPEPELENKKEPKPENNNMMLYIIIAAAAVVVIGVAVTVIIIVKKKKKA
ncbi:MAG: InlB B-repeat-containing protein, partial [Clostridia bacterium]|nr:InlB B-repeat-containing protein [Clostridia bacterium]